LTIPSKTIDAGNTDGNKELEKVPSPMDKNSSKLKVSEASDKPIVGNTPSITPPPPPDQEKEDQNSNVKSSSSQTKVNDSIKNLETQKDEECNNNVKVTKKFNILNEDEKKQSAQIENSTTSSSKIIACAPLIQTEDFTTTTHVKSSEKEAASFTTTSSKPKISDTASARIESANTASLEAMKQSFALLSSSIHVPIPEEATVGAAAGVKNTFPSTDGGMANASTPTKVPRRKPGARECMQISRRFGVNVIPQKYMEILLDYKNRGKLEHLIRMRERLDEHALMLEAQYAGLLCLIKEKGEIDFSSTTTVNSTTTANSTTTTSGNNCDSKPPPHASST